MIITLGGMPGSGKSTLAKALAKEFGLKHYYLGQIYRDIAKKKGMTIQEFTEANEKDKTFDNELDNYQKNLRKTEDNFIIEGRTSFHFIPNSIKIFVDVEIKEASKRILGNLSEKRNEGKQKTLEEMEEQIKRRLNSDKKRYKKYYNIDYLDKQNYDIIIDSTKQSIEEMIKETKSKIKNFTKNNEN